MADNEFEDPAAPPPPIDWTALNGRLLLITVNEVVPTMTTTYGDKEAVRADIVVLDGPNAGELHDNTPIFPGVLISQLKTRVGRKVLGRLGYGTAKAGQRPPWKLEAATPADRQLATSYQANTTHKPADPWSSPASAPQGGNPPF